MQINFNNHAGILNNPDYLNNLNNLYNAFSKYVKKTIGQLILVQD